jgi:hypothetical protein
MANHKLPLLTCNSQTDLTGLSGLVNSWFWLVTIFYCLRTLGVMKPLSWLDFYCMPSLYRLCTECIVNTVSTIVASLASEMCLLCRCLAVTICIHSTILTFCHNVTVLFCFVLEIYFSFGNNFCINKRPTLWDLAVYFLSNMFWNIIARMVPKI